jgi:hypothetical protein
MGFPPSGIICEDPRSSAEWKLTFGRLTPPN